MELDNEAKEKTAFSTGDGLWQFAVMPFDLCNAPATFERLMESFLSGLPWTTCLVYLDDILVHAKTFDEEIVRLREVFSRLRAADLKLNPKKCELFRREVVYLGHVVSADGVATDMSEIEAVRTWPIPQNKKELQRFLGLCSYYRKFVPAFSVITSPLRRLTEKDATFRWSDECEMAFEKLKDLLTNAPILAYPLPDGKFSLDTDSCQFGIGDVLSQEQNGQELVIAYFSRSLSRAEKNYCVTRKELFAVVKAVEKFHYYLYGRRFVIKTDHSSLRWLLSFRQPECQTTRWIQKLQLYDFEIIYRPGRTNSNADALSRRPCYSSECGYCERLKAKEVPNDENSMKIARNATTEEKSFLKIWTREELISLQNTESDIGPIFR